LSFDPNERISALDALQYPYFPEYRHLGAKASPLLAEEFSFESQTPKQFEMREEFLKEILHYHTDMTKEILR